MYNILAFTMFGICVGNDGRNAEVHMSAKSFLVKRVIVTENSKIKAKFKAMLYVRNIKKSA